MIADAYLENWQPAWFRYRCMADTILTAEMHWDSWSRIVHSYLCSCFPFTEGPFFSLSIFFLKLCSYESLKVALDNADGKHIRPAHVTISITGYRFQATRQPLKHWAESTSRALLMCSELYWKEENGFDCEDCDGLDQKSMFSAVCSNVFQHAGVTRSSRGWWIM